MDRVDRTGWDSLRDLGSVLRTVRDDRAGIVIPALSGTLPELPHSPETGGLA